MVRLSNLDTCLALGSHTEWAYYTSLCFLLLLYLKETAKSKKSGANLVPVFFFLSFNSGQVQTVIINFSSLIIFQMVDTSRNAMGRHPYIVNQNLSPWFVKVPPYNVLYVNPERILKMYLAMRKFWMLKPETPTYTRLHRPLMKSGCLKACCCGRWERSFTVSWPSLVLWVFG